MHKNVGFADRGVRLIVAAVLGFFIAMQFVDGWFAIVLGVIAALLAVTALLGICPFYRVAGLDTQPQVNGDDNPFAVHH